MPEVKVRKMITSLEEIWHEGGPRAEKPYCRAWALAVIENPYAGRYEPEIQPFIDDLRPLGLEMAQKLIDMLGGKENVEGYGKGAIVGEGGEIEHGALWHAPGGYAMRQLLGADASKAIVPSTKKVGGVGARLDVPVTHVMASYVRSHFDAIEVGCTDAPRAGEIALALVMTNGARVHSRSGGLEAWDIKGEDGLR
ncbi:amino acid synthesis family protein [Marimonas lutisalis]|uniref:amino acid synthesis family protein n=1 Tax=Marimonas lutisalis TaxID=2545756 RepID=UPI0010F87EB7|nr:amino acid synthesis family protein [Marimonas lutisalis]